ncbi:uncharacterized protein LOC112089738 [Eutrema salsugineum]|uniref:uncharacterized protein LOC112089738 n=1 Tax=Eutrema salsugineum TaxID=72664 RepID=UPI000CED446B|nr:uncharacterized protein LOC112089738 [Eutrema salsugineum]
MRPLMKHGRDLKDTLENVIIMASNKKLSLLPVENLAKSNERYKELDIEACKDGQGEVELCFQQEFVPQGQVASKPQEMELNSMFQQLLKGQNEITRRVKSSYNDPHKKIESLTSQVKHMEIKDHEAAINEIERLLYSTQQDIALRGLSSQENEDIEQLSREVTLETEVFAIKDVHRASRDKVQIVAEEKAKQKLKKEEKSIEPPAYVPPSLCDEFQHFEMKYVGNCGMKEKDQPLRGCEKKKERQRKLDLEFIDGEKFFSDDEDCLKLQSSTQMRKEVSCKVVQEKGESPNSKIKKPKEAHSPTISKKKPSKTKEEETLPDKSSTTTLIPLTHQDGVIEYKVKCRGGSKPFAKVRAVLTQELKDKGEDGIEELMRKVVRLEFKENPGSSLLSLSLTKQKG